jgi:putative inorganic carbon (HCO3(-)) transporter
MIRGWSRDWNYFLISMSLWCFMPEIRRLLDWRSGAFSSIQILSLVPLLSVLPLLFFCLKKDRLARLSPALRFFALAWLVAYSYGMVVGVLNGAVAASVYSFASFIIPVIGGVWIATQELAPAATLRRLAGITLSLGGIVGVYGVIQFISPPPWDVLWVLSANMQNVGPPEPFMMRVFSTLNSPGPNADFLAIVLVLGLSGIGLRAIYMWPLMASIAAALTLTLVRSAWIGLVMGIVAYLVFSPRRWRTLPMIAVFAMLATFLVVSLPTVLGDDTGGSQIVSRLQTFSDLGHDGSALDRQGEIANTFQTGNQNPLGTGLGQIGSAAKLATSDQEGAALDSGFLARFSELGYPGFFLYIIVIFGTAATLAKRLFTSASRCSVEDRVALATSLALCVVVLAFEAAGDSYNGIVGLFAWLAIGSGLHWQFNALATKGRIRTSRFAGKRMAA